MEGRGPPRSGRRGRRPSTLQTNMIDLTGLNPQQRVAVTHGDGPLASGTERSSRGRGPARGPMTGISEGVKSDGRMRSMLEHVAKQLVDDPASVAVTEELDGDFIKLHLRVAEGDVGKVIGRGGRIAKAIRALLKVMATRDGTKVNLEID